MMFEGNEERADRKQLLAIIRELREELQTERAYSLQLREKSIRDVRELRAMREAVHELRRRLHALGAPGPEQIPATRAD